MSIIGIDVGSTTTKIIEYNDKKIIKSKISLNINAEEVLEEFIKYNSIDINNIEKMVITGIGANKFKTTKYNIPIKIAREFEAIATGGLNLANKKEALIVSIGTGTALIRANKEKIVHLGGTRNWCGNINDAVQKI